jgi:glutathione S-transferase
MATATRTRYQLYYWPGIQGRGEFVRLALEEAGAAYDDVARQQGAGKGVPAMLALMKDARRAPFAPPFVRVGRLLVAQTANILQWLGPRLELVPADEAARRWAHQVQLTITDFVHEVHDTHHPIAVSLYYEDQRAEALRRTHHFLKERAPKHLAWLERAVGGGRYALGARVSYVDLSVFQVMAGMRYAFPRAMKRMERRLPRLVALHQRVAARSNIGAYLDSPRRIAFNEMGIFRRYPELDL